MSYTHKNLAHSHGLPGLMLVQVLLIYTLRETVFEEQTYFMKLMFTEGFYLHY